MKKAWILTFAILCVVCLVSCQSPQEDIGDDAAVSDDSPSSEEAQIAEDNEQAEDTQASGSPTEETDPSGSGEPEAISPEPMDECANCHIDKQMLIDYAKPLEALESENEGEG